MRLLSAAPGKVNLCLFLGAPRADGYHPLVSLVQPVSLADEVVLEPGGDRDEVVCAGVSGENLAGHALALYRETGWDGPPVRLTIAKRVPVAAGMGGGSADAAAALRLAAAAAGRPGDPSLGELAPRLGADVPSQIEPRRCLMTGIGEHIQALALGPPMTVVVVPSPHALATPAVYAEADRLGLGRPAADLAALEAEVHAAVAAGGALPDHLAVNDLEPAARSLCPWIDGALDDVRAAGAERAMVSGSGPTVFGLFSDAAAAGAAVARLGRRHPGAVVAEPVGPEFAAVVRG
jgi:4-diphosphocytidyl-2-C-methyl-D-erythritol kinase